MVKSARMRWKEYAGRTKELRCAYKIWAGRPEGKTPLGCILLELEGVDWINFLLSIGSGGGLLL